MERDARKPLWTHGRGRKELSEMTDVWLFLNDWKSKGGPESMGQEPGQVAKKWERKEAHPKNTARVYTLG